MYCEHQDKVKQFYNFQENLYRALGAYYLSENTSKVKKIFYELYSMTSLLFVGSYNLALLIAFITLPTILDKIMKVFFMLGTVIGALVKLIYLRRNFGLFRSIAIRLHKDRFIPANESENAILLKHFGISKGVRNLYCTLSCMSLCYIFVLQQIINKEELPAVIYTPLDLNVQKNITVMKVYAFIAVTILCFSNISFDSWCTSFLIFAKGQLEILQYRLQRLGDNFTNDSDINEELKNCIRLHGEICDLVEQLEMAIAFPNSLQIFCSVSVLCCNFYALSFTSISEEPKAFIKFIVYQNAMLAQIFLICFFANEVTLASTKLSYALYSSNWIWWNKSNRKLMLLTLQRFQNPIKIRSINCCFCFDLSAFSWIINTSYSYFALLKQMNN